MRRTLGAISLCTLALLSSAFVSTNVPLGHWSYDAVDRLIGHGLIDSAMMTTKPVSRLEMARHIAEAAEKAQQLNEQNEIILAILDRLKNEFKVELIALGELDGELIQSSFKPIEDPYVKYVLAENTPDLENQRGDVFRKHSNYRAGFASRMMFSDVAAFYVHPEFVDSSSDAGGDIDLIECYGKLAIPAPAGTNLELELGKDSLWWGPGYEGSMLMSNNAEPFKMVKMSTPNPMQLPWLLRRFGPFKAVWFLTELEEDRTVAKPKLTGLRLNFKPHPAVEVGLSRAIMFGGSGMPHVGLRNYVSMWRPQKEQEQNNQLAGFDVSVLLPMGDKWPVKSVKFYGDFAGEDEAGWLPSKWGELLGMHFNDVLRTGRTDLRIEYADNRVSGEPNVFYTHSLYQAGYTYKDRIIGHHMGTDARDILIRLTHYLTEDVILGAEFDREVTHLSSESRPATNRLGLDLTLFAHRTWQLKTAYRYEDTQDGRGDNHIFFLQLVYDF
jgi:hypothetical protein